MVWSWDITYLPGPVKGLFYYLYLFLDIFSRNIVGWEVWEEESAEYASQLIARTCLSQGILSQPTPLVLHSDYAEEYTMPRNDVKTPMEARFTLGVSA
jgi:putative transposase